MNRKAAFIKNKKSRNEDYSKDDLLFIEFVDAMYQFKHKLFSTNEPMSFEKLKLTLDILIGITYSGNFTSRSTYYSRSVAAGFFGYKKTCPHHNTRMILFSKLLNYFIKSKNSFQYGIDEVLLKIILSFETGTCDLRSGRLEKKYLRGSVFFMNKKKIDDNYIKLIFSQSTKCNKIEYLFNNNSFLEDNVGNKIVINEFVNNAYEDIEYGYTL